MKKKALIIGVSGQDGCLLSSYLLSQDYEVYGTSRNNQNLDLIGSAKRMILSKISLINMDAFNYQEVLSVVTKVMPDEIYNLSGPSSVASSFKDYEMCINTIQVINKNILQAICETDENVRFLNAGSSEIFGNVKGKITSKTVFQPISPYAIGKAKSVENIISFRDRFGIFACSAFLFNHESLLRKTTFVTAKVVQGAQRHARGHKDKISVGNIEIKRDWGWAYEYVEAMHRILQLDKPVECIIATGETNSLEQFISHAYKLVGLNWEDHISIDESLYRKSEIIENYADIEDTARILDWRAKYKMKDIIEMMVHGRDWDSCE